MTATQNIEFNNHFLPIRNMLYSVALRYTKNRNDADDLVQETSLKVYKNYQKYNPEYDFKSWTVAIMENTFISNLRKVKTARNHLQGFKHYRNSELTTSTKVSENQAQDVQNKLWVMIEELPSKSKEPFVMYLDGYRYEEIASHLEIPIGTVKSRINYARTKLRNQLSSKELRYQMAG
jgi:RNA polymerase sigma-70 factor (ECF subfamily)